MAHTNRTLDYLSTVTYGCPEGFVLDTSGMDVPSPTEMPELTFVCDRWNDWTPMIQPKCIREF